MNNINAEKKSPNSNILIVGAGAIGLLWFSRFYVANAPRVNCFLYQSPERQSIKPTVAFTDTNNTTFNIPTQVFPNTSQTNQIDKKITFDIILICVKSYQVNQAIADIAQLLSPHTIIVKTHNGLGALNEKSSDTLQHHMVLDLLTTHGCLKLAANKIVHTGIGSSDLGCTTMNANETIKQAITQRLHSTLPNVYWCDDMLLKQWTKLAINCVINPLTALFDVKNGEIIKHKFDETINQLLSEIQQVAKLSGVTFHSKHLKETVLKVAKNTANNSSSMRCDIQQKRKTEIEYINGYIHQRGQVLNIVTPKNTELFYKISAL